MRFDTHIHTDFSLCSNIHPEDLVIRAEKEGLDEIVIKDHNDIEGAIEAWEFATEVFRKQIKVNLGIEFSTEAGEFGASFLTLEEAHGFMRIRKPDETFSFRKLTDKIREMREGGSEMLVDLHHPFDYANPKRGFNFDVARQEGGFTTTEDAIRFFDFTELNTASTQMREMMNAQMMAEANGLPIVCSTDSHFLSQIGRYYTETDHDSAREAILANDMTHSISSPEEVDLFRSKMFRLRSWMLKRVRKITG